MGCVSSSDVQEAKKFAMNITKIGIPKWDDFFGKVGDIAGTLCAIDDGMGEDVTQKIYYKLGLYWFKNQKDINLYEAFKIFLWAMAAQNEGKIVEVCSPTFIFSDPYFTIKIGKADPKLQEVANLIVKYIMTVLKEGPKIPQLCINLVELVKSGKEMQKTFKEDVKSCKDMKMTDQMKAIGNIGKGLKSVFDIGNAAAGLPGVVASAIDLCTKLGKEFQTILEDAKKQGQECIAKNVLKQKLILKQFHPAEKFTDKNEYIQNLIKLKLDKKLKKKKGKKGDKKDKKDKKEDKKDKKDKKEDKKDKKEDKKEEKKEEKKDEKKEEKQEEKKEEKKEEKQEEKKEEKK